MRLRKMLGLSTLILFFLFFFVGCGSNAGNGNGGNDTEKAGVRIVFRDMYSNVDIREPIIKEGPEGGFEMFEIPKIKNYVFWGVEESIPIVYSKPIIELPLYYLRLLNEVGPNQGRVVFMFVDAETRMIFDIDDVVGEIGTSLEYVNTYHLSSNLKLANPDQAAINIEFKSEDQVIVINYNQKTPEERDYEYKINYLEKNTDKVLHDQLKGEHSVGTLNLKKHPVIPGYRLLTAETELSITMNAVNNVLNVYYEKDPAQWATITFAPGENATFTPHWATTTFEVIKNHPFNGKNQPGIKPPGITPKSGYKLDPAGSWSPVLPDFKADGTIDGDKTYTAQVVVDENQKFNYTVLYITNTYLGLHDQLTGKSHVGTLDLESHPVIPGYRLLTTETKIKITGDENINFFRIFYEKDPDQWATINFSTGENARLEGATSYEVIKNHPFNGRNQPQNLNAPTIYPYLGYKVNPDGAWYPKFATNETVDGDQTFVAQIVVDESKVFNYAVDYLEEGNPSKQLHNQLRGSRYIGTLNLEHPTLAGYELVTTQTTLEITNRWEQNYLRVYYRKVAEDWVTITFTVGENGVLAGITSYEVIKNHPFNGQNQPKIKAPTIETYPGYKVDPNGAWSPALPNFNSSGTINEDKTYTAQIVINENVKFDYRVNYLEAGTDRMLKYAKTGTHCIGTLDLGEHPTLAGYKPSTTSTTLEITTETANILNVYYEKDPDQWTIITFVAGPNSTVTETQFEVIKNCTFGYSPLHPPITPPTITPDFAYKVNPSGAWSPAFSSISYVLGPQTYTAQVIKDATYWVTVEFISGENASFTGVSSYEILKDCPFNDPKQPTTVEVPTINPNSGYKVDPNGSWSPALPDFKSSGTINENKTYTAQLVVDQEQKFDYQVNYFEENTTKVLHTATTGKHYIGTVEVVAHPEIVGYTLKTTNRTIQITANEETNVLNVYYSKVQNMWATVTFAPGEHTTLEGTTSFEVLKNYPFNDENQLTTVTPPTIHPNSAYLVDPSSAWSPAFSLTDQVDGNKTYTAQVIKNPDYWRDVSVKHVGQDLSGNYTVTLKTEPTVNLLIGSTINLASNTFTGFTYNTSNPTTYTVTEEASPQEVSITYSRNKYTISFNSYGGSPNPGSISNVYYGTEVIDELLSITEPTMTGYTLDGWIIYHTGTLLGLGYKMPNMNITLRAQWKANTYTIMFSPNCISYTGTMPNQEVTYNQTTTLNKNNYVCIKEKESSPDEATYDFMGWATSSTGNVQYLDEEEIRNLATGGVVRLYAVWRRIYCTGEYPQTKVTDQTLISKLLEQQVVESSKALEASNDSYKYTEVWKTVTYEGNKYERIGDDFYKYETIAFYVLGDYPNEFVYSKYILDYSPYDCPESSTNYENTYIKNYLFEVFEAKAGFLGFGDSLLLTQEQLSNPTYFDGHTRKAISTDYAKAVLRGERMTTPWYWTEHDICYDGFYWTRTPTLSSGSAYCVEKNGSISQYGITLYALGIRYVIW